MKKTKEEETHLILWMHFKEQLQDYEKLSNAKQLQILNALTCEQCLDYKLKVCPGEGYAGYEIYECMEDKTENCESGSGRK